jgi:hypothetical protein
VRRALPSILLLVAFGFTSACSGSAESDLYTVRVDASEPAESAPAEAAPIEAATEAAPDAGTPETGSDGMGALDSSTLPGTISCGSPGATNTCTTPSEFCCVTYNGGPKGDQNINICGSNASDCSAQMGTTVRCSSSTQCPTGEVCCGTGSSDSPLVYTDVSCQPSCGLNDHLFCDPTVLNDCPATAHCQSSSVLTSFNICFNLTGM